jgi:hypothetical protein
MRGFFYSLFSGLLFGAGLALSGMTQTEKVFGFLDLTGNWDASLAFVMVGAISVYAVAYRLLHKRSRSLLGSKMHAPQKHEIDRKLLLGALLFGVGWGLGGFCPGPALVSLGAGAGEATIFVGAMLVGMWLQQVTTPEAAPVVRRHAHNEAVRPGHHQNPGLG